MAKTLAQAREKTFTGWHMLAIMVAFFGVVISVNLLMAWYATSTWSGLVVPNSYVASQEFNEKAAEARALAATGIETQLTLEDGAVSYRVLTADGQAVDGVERVHAVFRRPVESHEDVEIDLVSLGGGIFGAAQALKPGQWIADIETTGNGRRIYREAQRIIVKGAKP